MRSLPTKLAGLAVAVFLAASGISQPANAVQTKPNVIMIMTDDQTLEQMRFLPRTQALIGGDQGTTFDNSFVNFALCCPSRATYLTGQYMHNHKVFGNEPPLGGYAALNHSNTLPVWLKTAGYATAHMGKYLNGYGSTNVNQRPAGWTEWYGGIDYSFYRTYDYKMNRNGVIKQYGHAPEDYSTDVIANDAVDFVNRRAISDKPYFLSVHPLAPHREGTADGSAGSVPIVPAERHKGLFSTLELPKLPNYNEADVTDKPRPTRNLPLMTQNVENFQVRAEYRSQAEGLQAVDEMVERIYNAVAASGELDKTVIMFTSDNGYFHGEHRHTGGKTRVYEEVIRVPLLARGPGFTPGAHPKEPVQNVDLAPTIVSLAGATPLRVMDGRTLFDRDPNRVLLLEVAGHSNPYTAVRVGWWKWVEYANGDREQYNLYNDPYELTSKHTVGYLTAQKRSELKALLAKMRTCAGDTCRNPYATPTTTTTTAP